MSQEQKAQEFAQLHVAGTPVQLFNIWDAGSATTLAKAGARAIATGSASVAAAQGYGDGQKIPLEFLVMIAERIAASVDVPVSIDFEGGYAREVDGLARNITRLIRAGVVGVNFEDQIVGQGDIYSVEEQCTRIAAVRAAAQKENISLFVNARTDLFLKASRPAAHESLLGETIARGEAYAAAGASGFFVPGLVDAQLIGKICAALPLPVNVMMMPGCPSPQALADQGVARISYGPGPYREMVKGLKKAWLEQGVA